MGGRREDETLNFVEAAGRGGSCGKGGGGAELDLLLRVVEVADALVKASAGSSWDGTSRFRFFSLEAEVACSVLVEFA
jgi:hypothetical protein